MNHPLNYSCAQELSKHIHRQVLYTPRIVLGGDADLCDNLNHYMHHGVAESLHKARK